jgi:hypothetical protein
MNHIFILLYFYTFVIVKVKSQSICKFGEIYDVDINNCTSCKNKNQYYKDNKCVDYCEDYPGLIKDYNYCFKCDKNKNEFYYRLSDLCLSFCPKNTIPNTVWGFCQECGWEGNFFFNSTCVSECPLGTVVDSDNYVCINCKDNNTYHFNNQCYDSCPLGTALDDFLLNSCIECRYQGRNSLDSGGCSDTCNKKGYAIVDDICQNCTEKNLFLQNGRCEDMCIGNDYQEIGNLCDTCKGRGHGLFMIDDFTSNEPCVENCGNLMTDWVHNICIKDLDFYLNKMSSQCNGVSWLIDSNNNFLCYCYDNELGNLCQIKYDQDFFYKNETIQMFNYLKGIHSDPLFDFKNSKFYKLFRHILLLLIFNNPQTAFQNTKNTYISILETFLQTEFKNSYTNINVEDVYNLVQGYDTLISLKYYLLYGKYFDFPAALDANYYNMDQLLTSIITNYETLIVQLSSFMSNMLPTKQNNTNKYLEYYIEAGGNILFYKCFSANQYNYFYQVKNNIDLYKSYFRTSILCLATHKGYFLSMSNEMNIHYLLEKVLTISNYYNLMFFNSNFTLSNFDCPVYLYFPIRDTENFNFTNPLKLLNSLKIFDINPFDYKDPFFNNVCYSYNSIYETFIRSDRVKKYFLNFTAVCVSKLNNVNEENTEECSFIGIENSRTENGPNPYIICNCPYIDSKKTYYFYLKEYNLTNLPSNIPQFWKCFERGFKMENIFYNSGFLVINILSIFELTFIVIHFMLFETIFVRQFNNIILYDFDFVRLQFSDAKDEILKLVTKKALYQITIVNETHNMKNREATDLVETQNIFNKFGYSDYFTLPMDLYLMTDTKRTNFKYFLDYLYEYHIITLTFFKFSYFVPGYLRMMRFFLYLVTHYFLMSIYISPEEKTKDIFNLEWAGNVFTFKLGLYYFTLRLSILSYK